MSEGEKCEACGDPLGEHHPTEVALGLCYHGYSVHERETGHSIEECFGPRGHLFRDAELEGEGEESVCCLGYPDACDCEILAEDEGEGVKA